MPVCSILDLWAVQIRKSCCSAPPVEINASRRKWTSCVNSLNPEFSGCYPNVIISSSVDWMITQIYRASLNCYQKQLMRTTNWLYMLLLVFHSGGFMNAVYASTFYWLQGCGTAYTVLFNLVQTFANYQVLCYIFVRAFLAWYNCVKKNNSQCQ